MKELLMNTNKEFDFNRYDDIAEAAKYNGFIDQDGYFYKVSPRNHYRAKIDHNLWARAYVKAHGDRFKRMDFSASGLFTLSQISSEVDVLVHIYGFVYYSHDDQYFKPIIKCPDPKYNKFIMNRKQSDFLFGIMLINNENPFENPIFNDDRVYKYVGLYDEQDKKKR